MVNGGSLNKHAVPIQGPDLNNKLVDAFLKFRLFENAIMADVEAMFMQITNPKKKQKCFEIPLKRD